MQENEINHLKINDYWTMLRVFISPRCQKFLFNK